MRRFTIICITLVAAALGLVPSTARAATSTSAAASTPTITRVTPMRVRVGALLTIRGRNFKATRTKNTVIFRAPDGRTAFAKPRRASRTRLVVAVPPAVARLVKLGKGHPLQAACAGRQVQSLHLAPSVPGRRLGRRC